MLELPNKEPWIICVRIHLFLWKEFRISLSWPTFLNTEWTHYCNSTIVQIHSFLSKEPTVVLSVNLWPTLLNTELTPYYNSRQHQSTSVYFHTVQSKDLNWHLSDLWPQICEHSNWPVSHPSIPLLYRRTTYLKSIVHDNVFCFIQCKFWSVNIPTSKATLNIINQSMRGECVDHIKHLLPVEAPLWNEVKYSICNILYTWKSLVKRGEHACISLATKLNKLRKMSIIILHLVYVKNARRVWKLWLCFCNFIAQ